MAQSTAGCLLQLSLVGSRPRACQQAQHEAHTLPLSPQNHFGFKMRKPFLAQFHCVKIDRQQCCTNIVCLCTSVAGEHLFQRNILDYSDPPIQKRCLVHMLYAEKHPVCGSDGFSPFRYLLSQIRLSLRRLSVTFVCPTQPVEIFGSISTPSSTLAMR